MEKSFWPEGVILPQLGIFEVFHYKSELQPGVLTIFWLFVDRPVSKSLQRVFLMFYLFYFIFPLFQDLSSGNSRGGLLFRNAIDSTRQEV